MYPTKMEANGHVYEINTDFRIALACFRAMNDAEITDLERFYAIETLLLGDEVDPDDDVVLQKKILDYLRCGQEENIDIKEIDMDYIQDESKIRTSIRQCYLLDLNRIDYMHWWEYNELISGLTSETLLNKVRELRSFDLNEIKDLKEREQVRKAQEYVALKKVDKKETKLTKEQEDSINYFYQQIGLERKED
jgi:hypothetical protein